MSDPASVALLVLIAMQIVLLVALAVVAVLASLAIVEATALTRRGLRAQQRRVSSVNRSLESTVERKVVEPVAQFERGAAWVESVARQLSTLLSGRDSKQR